ncbi:MAG: hypothetical protein ACFHW5_11665 [Verrucomicrobiota bacterium]
MMTTTRKKRMIILFSVIFVITYFSLFTKSPVSIINNFHYSSILHKIRAASAEGRLDDAMDARKALVDSGPEGLIWLSKNAETHSTAMNKLKTTIWSWMPNYVRTRYPLKLKNDVDYEIFGLMEEYGPQAAQYFTKYLDESKYQLATRQHAYRFIGKIGNNSINIIHALSQHTNSTSTSDKLFSYNALAELDNKYSNESSNYVHSVLYNGIRSTSNDRLWATYRIASMHQPERAIHFLKPLVRDPDPFVSRRASKLIEKLNRKIGNNKQESNQ